MQTLSFSPIIPQSSSQSGIRPPELLRALLVRDARRLRLDVERLPDLAGVRRRQGLLAAAARPVVAPLAGDRRDGAVPVDGPVAERHGVQRHAVAARHVFWDVGGFRGVERAADAEPVERFGDEGAERGDAAGGDADAVLDRRPDRDVCGGVWEVC